MATMTESKANKLFKSTINEIKDLIPLELNKIENSVKITNYKTSLAKCRRSKLLDRYTICLSKYLLECDEKLIKETIIHELIHTLKGCFNHGYNFIRYANFIKYKTGYNIVVKNSDPQFGQKIQKKYKITCLDCGKVFYRHRLSVYLKHGFCKHVCGGELKVEQLY